MFSRWRLVWAGLVFLAALSPDPPVPAAELGHFNPGLPHIRDFFVPESGLYYLQYNYCYRADTYRDRHGRSVNSFRVGPVKLDIETDLDIFVVTPTLIWVSPREFLGARYGVYVISVFGNTSVAAATSTAGGRGRSIEKNQFAPGDIFVQPLWLGWSFSHWDFSFGYGFYAPVGKYHAGAADNVGLGFWTNQFQGAAAWYPWENRGTAVTAALTHEINSKQEGVDVTPGSHLTLNWGVSQYLPVSGDDLLLELGLTGYDQWKVTGDSGDGVRQPGVHDRVHAAGLQAGLISVPWNGYLDFRYLREFDARARFEGDVFNLSLSAKF